MFVYVTHGMGLRLREFLAKVLKIPPSSQFIQKQKPISYTVKAPLMDTPFQQDTLQ